MAFQKNVWTFLFFIIIGALVGTVLGELLGILFSGTARKFLTEGVPIGFDPINLNLRIAVLTFGFSFKFSILSLVGIFCGGYYYQKYL